MSIDTLIANKGCISLAIRQAGYPSLATQTENDLAELCRMQTDELTKCRQALGYTCNERDNLLLAMRAIIGTIEGPCVFRTDYATRESEILAEAKKALEDDSE